MEFIIIQFSFKKTVFRKIISPFTFVIILVNFNRAISYHKYIFEYFYNAIILIFIRFIDIISDKSILFSKIDLVIIRLILDFFLIRKVYLNLIL